MRKSTQQAGLKIELGSPIPVAVSLTATIAAQLFCFNFKTKTVTRRKFTYFLLSEMLEWSQMNTPILTFS